MANLDILTLENNKDYYIIDTLINDNNKYLFLINKEDDNDMVIRKVIKKENEEYVVKLENEDEFDEVMAIFAKNYTGGKNEK